MQAIANVVARGVLQSAAASSAAATVTTQPACASDNDYDGRTGVRVSAIFVILVGSMFGSLQRPISNARTIESLTNYCRGSFPSLRGSPSRRRSTGMGVLYRQILWLRRHHSHGVHPPPGSCLRCPHRSLPHGPDNRLRLGGRHCAHDHLCALLHRTNGDALRYILLFRPRTRRRRGRQPHRSQPSNPTQDPLLSKRPKTHTRRRPPLPHPRAHRPQ